MMTVITCIVVMLRLSLVVFADSVAVGETALSFVVRADAVVFVDASAAYVFRFVDIISGKKRS